MLDRLRLPRDGAESEPASRSAEPERWKTLVEDFHWHIQILPRLGRELGSGFYANTVTPERAAAALRLEL